MQSIPPKEMANQIVKLLGKQRPDAQYVKKVFQYVRESLGLKGGTVRTKKLPELMTEDELKRFYEAVWKGFDRSHMIMLKLMLFTGIRNDELVNLTLQDVDLDQMRIRINQGKGGKDRYVLFPPTFVESWLNMSVSSRRKEPSTYSSQIV